MKLMGHLRDLKMVKESTISLIAPMR